MCYKLFSTTLEGIGFDINPYDRREAKKGMQCNITWYVDDNKLSHKNTAGISNTTKERKKHFRYLPIVRGNKHIFLGMTIKIKKTTLHIYMVKNLRERITMFGRYVSSPVSSPATKIIWSDWGFRTTKWQEGISIPLISVNIIVHYEKV